MAAMPIYGKISEKSSSQELSFETESWYIALGTQGLPNDDPRVAFDLFTAKFLS